MKRLLLAIGIGGVVFGGVYGLAAGVGVSSQTLGSGSSVVAACQASTLTASYATTYSSALPGYKVGLVTVNGLDTSSPTNCASKAFKITLTTASNASLAEVSGTTPASGTSFTADFSAGNAPATSVTGVHLVISG